MRKDNGTKDGILSAVTQCHRRYRQLLCSKIDSDAATTNWGLNDNNQFSQQPL